MADEPRFISEGLANLPALTAGELTVLLGAVDTCRMAATGQELHVLWSLSTAISEAIYAAQLDARRRDAVADEPLFPGPLYRRCEDDDCPDAYAYRAPFPAAEHYHLVGDGRG